MKFAENLTHVFTFGEDHILLDVNSGAVHQLSHLAHEMVQFWRRSGLDLEQLPAALPAALSRGAVAGAAAASATDIREICQGLEELAQAGLLMSGAPELQGYQLPEDYVVKALCLHVAHDCNLRCRYCFAGTGAFGGGRSLMSYETGRKALDFLFTASGSRRHVEVDYFGGEPLLNFPVVRELILYGEAEARRRGKELKQTLTTNGLLLQGPVLDFLNGHNIALVLSLDGRKEVHDRMRPTPHGQGSYQACLAHFKETAASRQGDNYYLRGTYTRFNKDFYQDVCHMVNEGFNLISMEPVVAQPQADYAFHEEDLNELFRQYDRLARYYVERSREGRPFTFFHFNLDLNQGPCLPKRLSGCGAGHEYLAVAPEGSLYPCHQFVGNPAFAVGDVDKGIEKPEISRRFRECHVLAKEKCRDCWARFYCSGGCHANAWNFNQDLRKPYDLGCALEKKRLECAIWIKVAEAAEA